MQVGWEVSVAEHRFLGELREFLRFLSSLWGILAGISLLFPLSNVLAKVIPVSDAGRPFEDLSSAIVTSVTTVTCLFVTFATFGRRDQFGEPERRPRLSRSARISFGLGVAALAVYLLAHNALYSALIADNPNNVLGAALHDGFLGGLYVAFFALLTRAFQLLAMLEYFAPRTDHAVRPPADPANRDPSDD